MSRWLSPADMVQYAPGVFRSTETLRYWRRIGEGPPSFKVGRRVVYKLEDVEAWLEGQRVAGDATS